MSHFPPGSAETQKHQPGTVTPTFIWTEHWMSGLAMPQRAELRGLARVSCFFVRGLSITVPDALEQSRLKALGRILAYYTRGIREHTGKEGHLASTWLKLSADAWTEHVSQGLSMGMTATCKQLCTGECASWTQHSYSNLLCMHLKKLWRKWSASKPNLAINISWPELSPDSSEENACCLLLRRRNDLPAMPVLPPAESPAPRQEAIRWPKLQFLGHISREAPPGWCKVSLFSDTKCKF